MEYEDRDFKQKNPQEEDIWNIACKYIYRNRIRVGIQESGGEEIWVKKNNPSASGWCLYQQELVCLSVADNMVA